MSKRMTSKEVWENLHAFIDGGAELLAAQQEFLARWSPKGREETFKAELVALNGLYASKFIDPLLKHLNHEIALLEEKRRA
jgi:hypothetical protein